jgi:hypothetical protein
MSDEQKKDKGFTVSDRRRFSVSETGEASEEAKPREEDKKPPEAKEVPPEKTDAAGKQKTEPAGSQEAETKEETTALPEINFSTFVVSLSSSALIHMGVVPDPMTGEQTKELAIAKQTIDMLGMIQEKTRGNLTDEEAQLLESMLYDLRMRYVAESK